MEPEIKNEPVESQCTVIPDRDIENDGEQLGLDSCGD